MPELAHLPGHDLYARGVEDLNAGRRSPEALLLAMARVRLTDAGLDVPSGEEEDPSHRLYDLLAEDEAATAHGRYNALLRRMASFARAAEHAASR